MRVKKFEGATENAMPAKGPLWERTRAFSCGANLTIKLCSRW